MRVVQVELEKLIPHARNARTHSDEQVAQVAASIREFGFTNPVLIDEENGIIAGHGRVLAARKLGLEKVPTIKLTGLSDVQKRAYILADNRLAEHAGWDEELLALELEELELHDFDLELVGFSSEEIDAILRPEGAAGTGSEDPPGDFPEFGEDIPTEHECPKCGYTWSGSG